MSEFDILFYNRRDDFGVPDLVEPELLAGGHAQIEDSPVHVGPAVVHAYHHALAVILAHHLEFRTEWQVLVRAGVVVLADLYGGTPFNKSALFRKKDIVILSGLNLNMALEVMGRRNRAEKVSEMNFGLILEESRKGITVLEG